MTRPRIQYLPATIFIVLCVLLWVFTHSNVIAWDPATYPDSAHGNSLEGVNRLEAGHDIGDCAHCHETFDDSICSVNELMLFAVMNPTSQTDNFCFECHDSASSVQAVTNYSYSRTFGGGSSTTPDDIKDAFAFGKPVGTLDDGSSHWLKKIRNWTKGKAWAPWVTIDTNACVICHDPHYAQKNTEVDPHSLGGVMTAVRRIADGGDNTSNQWGDEPLVTSGFEEMMSDYTAKYQAPYRVGETTYEPAGDGTTDGSNLPNSVAFCLGCHSMEVPEAKTDAPNRQHPQLELIAIDWGPSGDQMGEAHSPGDGQCSLGGTLKDPYTTDGDYVLCCTDCHEPHGSPNEYLLRTCVNGKDDCTVPANGKWYNFCSACHVIYTNDSFPKGCGMHNFTTAEAPNEVCRGCHSHWTLLWQRWF